MHLRIPIGTGAIAIAVALVALGASGADAQRTPSTGPARAEVPWATLADGPHAVGFRLEHALDHSRTVRPRRDFRGREAGEVAMPVQVATWYPARPQGTGRTLRFGDFTLMRATRDGVRPLVAADSADAFRGTQGMSRFAFNLSLDSAAVRRVLEQPMLARRDAPPLPGRFPVVLAITDGSLSTSAPLWEALASHGFVVVASSSRAAVAGLQTFSPALVIDERIRDLELLAARARELPNADASRLGVVGVNFDGMAALLWQMKNMRADAVASLDGWEGKHGAVPTVRGATHWDPRRLRVPYLLLLQHETQVNDWLRPDDAVFDALRWSERRLTVVRGAGHAHLVGGALAYPVDSAQRAASLEVARRVVAFVRQHVGGGARAPSARDTVPLTPALRDIAGRAAPAAPTADELEELMKGDDIGEIVRVLRDAQRATPEVPLFTPDAMRLYAFRRSQSGRRADAVQLLELSAEVHARSSRVQRDLGDAYVAVADTARARAAFARGIELVRAQVEVPAEARAQAEAEIRRRLDALGATPP